MRAFYVIFFLQLLLGCSKSTPTLESPNLGDDAVYTLKVEADSLPADNVTEAIVSVQSNKPVSNKQIVITTNRGTFSNNAQSITIPITNTVVRVYVKHNKAEPVKVAASISSLFSDNVDIHFIPAYPDTAFINTSNRLEPKLTSTTPIEAQLYRNKGNVSEDLTVYFEDSTELEKSIGTFVNTTRTNTLGKVTSEYRIQDTTYKNKFLYIKAYIINTSKKKKIIGRNKIYIK